MKKINILWSMALAVFLCSCGTDGLRVTTLSINHQKGAAALLTGEDMRLAWQMTSDVNGDCQTAYEIEIGELNGGKRMFSTGKVESDKSQGVEIDYEPKTDVRWRVRVWDAEGHEREWSEYQRIRVCKNDPILNEESKWIGAITKADAHLPEGRWSNAEFKKEAFKDAWKDVDTLSATSIILHKKFETLKGKKLTDATLFVCGLGHYETQINGEAVSDEVFAPLWTEYDKRVFYNTYDVGDKIGGENEIEILLGNGIYNAQRGGRYAKLQTSFGPPQARAALRLTYANGEVQTIYTDESWTYTSSPITFNSLYGGESYDARLERQTDAKSVVETEGPRGRLQAQTAPGIKINERYDVGEWLHVSQDSLEAAMKATKRTIDKSVMVADMRQNLAGFPEIKVVGKRGQKITLIPAENLTRQGVCDQRQTGRQHYYEYTIGTDGKEETWHPRFSYYGYRYVQVEGAVLEGQDNPLGLPVLKELKSCFIYASAEEVSSFECSSEVFTKAHRLIERAERSNMQSVLTDCPHREKLGWLEQDHLNGMSLLYNYDMTTYVRKIIGDIVDTQKEDGMVPTTAPQYVSFGNLFDDSPEWGSTLIILPFMYYEYYADSSLIGDAYDAMVRYVEYLGKRATENGGLVAHGLGDWYDYGPWRAGFARNTPVALVATAHYIFDLRLMARAAHMFGHGDDEKQLNELCGQTIEKFNETFFKADSAKYATGSQTSNALPLFLNIVPKEHKARVLETLLADIEAHGWRLTTGDVGNRYLFQTLAREGHNDIMIKMLDHYDTPGYGFQIRQGATTLTEQWDPRHGSSKNHFMMGQIDEWLFGSVAGIGQQTGSVGMKHLRIAPMTPDENKFCSAETQTIYGKVSVDVRTKDGLTTYKISIPVGSDAEIVMSDGQTRNVGSGRYTFTLPRK